MAKNQGSGAKGAKRKRESSKERAVKVARAPGESKKGAGKGDRS